MKVECTFTALAYWIMRGFFFSDGVHLNFDGMKKMCSTTERIFAFPVLLIVYIALAIKYVTFSLNLRNLTE